MNDTRRNRLSSEAELRDTVLGRSTRLARREAFALLLHSRYPEREELLASVVIDPREQPQERSAAAIVLGHIQTPKAELALTQLLSAVPDGILPDVLRSLGRIGMPTALEQIDVHAGSPNGVVAAAARFAGALIAHRFRLPGHDLPVPAREELLGVAQDNARPIGVGIASASEAGEVLASLNLDTYGIELASGPLTQLACGTDLNVLCVNRELSMPGSAQSLLERKALFALAALQSREGDGYSVSYVVLSSPAPAKGQIGLWAPRCSGRTALAGSATLDGERLHFSLRSVDRPGARPLAIDGYFELGRFTILTAVAAPSRTPAPAPSRTMPDEET